MQALWQAWRGDTGAGDRGHGLPWQVERLPGGATRVFGLTLGIGELGSASRRDGDLQLA